MFDESGQCTHEREELFLVVEHVSVLLVLLFAVDTLSAYLLDTPTHDFLEEPLVKLRPMKLQVERCDDSDEPDDSQQVQSDSLLP